VKTFISKLVRYSLPYLYVLYIIYGNRFICRGYRELVHYREALARYRSTSRYDACLRVNLRSRFNWIGPISITRL